MKKSEKTATLLQSDLFGMLGLMPAPQAADTRPKLALVKQKKVEAVIDGATFHSGSSAYNDALGIITAEKDIGVVADRLTLRITRLLSGYLARGGQCFCESGTYGEFSRWQDSEAASPLGDFEVVFAVYDQLVTSTPVAHRFNPALVMPDVIGHPPMKSASVSSSWPSSFLMLSPLASHG